MIKSAYRLYGFTLISLLLFRKRSCKGFTLIELLVVIAIIGTLIAVLLPQLSNFNREQTLKNATADLRSNIKKTQNNASSGLNCNSAGLAAKEWKINFYYNTTYYTIGAICSDGSLGTSVVKPFPSGIKIFDIQLGSTSCNSASVIFNNVSSAISFATTDDGCPVLGKNKMSILFGDPSAVGIGTTATVVIEKGGTVY